MICPKCGAEGRFGVVCKFCKTNLLNYITKDDYLGYLTEWVTDKEAQERFLKYWNSNDGNAFLFRSLFIDIEFEAENDPKLSKKLDEFKKLMFGKLFDAESCAFAYLINNEKALGEFKEYLSVVTGKRINTVERQSNIFGYYIKLINQIKIMYADIKGKGRSADVDKRLEKLYSVIIDNVNEILKAVCSNKLYRPNTNRFRRFKSKTYPNVHDEYCGYLRALKDAVLSANSEFVKSVFDEVK